jgi:predicted DNA-binding protein
MSSKQNYFAVRLRSPAADRVRELSNRTGLDYQQIISACIERELPNFYNLAWETMRAVAPSKNEKKP